jgi:hypothetical protein
LIGTSRFKLGGIEITKIFVKQAMFRVGKKPPLTLLV